ncbi:hypothetical protein EYF80_051787 [Liparis tanakae]|uniref:Uncharacterized protein n=1 Tax=Liparis tanakae TaxID=230148 RepID=A0A4Z2FAY7_9TELE|nr:hypothetical protein EYF80_051787 [Liparis tanakae]
MKSAETALSAPLRVTGEATGRDKDDGAAARVSAATCWPGGRTHAAASLRRPRTGRLRLRGECLRAGRLRAGRLRGERLRVHQQDVLPPDEQLVDVAFEDPAVLPGLFLPAGLRFDCNGAGASGLRPPAGGPVFRGSVWVLRRLVSRRVLLQLQLLEELDTGVQSR